MDLRKITIITAAILIGTTSVAMAKPKVAVLGLEVVEEGGIDAKIAGLATKLTDALRKRASVGAGPYSLAPNSKKDLLEMKLLGGCDNEARECMSTIGRDLGADVLIYGKLQKRKDGFQVSLKLLDVRKKQMIRTKSELIGLDDTKPARINEWARRLYNKLTGVPEQGTLAVKANVPTGQVYINGEIKGSLVDGAKNIAGLAEGTMEVRIESEGYETYSKEVTVKGGKTVKIDATLAKEGTVVPPPPPSPGRTSRILFWSTTAVAATGAVVATVSGLSVSDYEQDKLDAVERFQTSVGTQLEVTNVCDEQIVRDATDGDLWDIKDACETGRSRATLATVAWAVAGVSAAAAGFFFYKGYLQKGKESNVARKKGKRAPTVIVTPTVLPSYVGAGVSIEF